MKWTKDVPTEPGEYWWRENAMAERRVLRVTRVRAGLWVSFRGVVPADSIGGEWWPTPLVPPEEE